MLKKNFSTPYGSLLFMVEVQTDKSMNGLGFDLRIVWSFDLSRSRNPESERNYRYNTSRDPKDIKERIDFRIQEIISEEIKKRSLTIEDLLQEDGWEY